MTELTPIRPRHSSVLPSGKGLDLLVIWATEGPRNLAPPPSQHDGGRRNESRVHALQALRRLVNTLKIETAELEPNRGQARNFGALSDHLLNEIAWRARSYGYVTAGCRGRVPLSPLQIDVLYSVSWGMTLAEIARESGWKNSTSVSGILTRAREAHGCATVAQLVATAYRNGWFPGAEETRVLLRGQMMWDPSRPGYNRPPYKGNVE
ncbi:MAG TPA: hypothetical protein VFX97_20755 [Pyrinomonadaceae bacterium]|nr:hypothetical protein [Pyrinomonadaceae bacterium]